MQAALLHAGGNNNSAVHSRRHSVFGDKGEIMADYGHIVFGLVFVAICFWAARALTPEIPMAWLLYLIGFFIFVLVFFV
jgi:hypothetical protein